MTYSELWHQLLPLYDADEAQAIIRLLLDDRFQMTLTDIVMGRLADLSTSEQAQLEHDLQRLRQGEPVQYVLGHATFCGREFHVAPGVLIPRPETEQLCRLITDELNRPYCGLQPPTPLQVLDIGTGSGCIAITLALDLWNASVTAWDVSSDALLIARNNAHALRAPVSFELRDALASLPRPLREDGCRRDSHHRSLPLQRDSHHRSLPLQRDSHHCSLPLQRDSHHRSLPLQRDSHHRSLSAAPAPCWDVIVSNPPYIADHERATMSRNVLDHEPALALFVPDDDPLRFYRAIATYALDALVPGGRLFFEINPLYASDLHALLATLGYTAITLLPDQFGKQRFCSASCPLSSR